MTSAEGETAVVDHPSESRFVVTKDGTTAELRYHRADGRLVLLHTGVPRELAGHGIGGRLVRAAVERATREHLEVVPWCPFARRWIEEHPDEVGDLSVDWTSPPEPRPD